MARLRPRGHGGSGVNIPVFFLGKTPVCSPRAPLPRRRKAANNLKNIMMIKKIQSFTYCIGILLLIQCKNKPNATNQSIYLGQGMMCGEVSDQSAILQARLTTSEELIDGELPGQQGWLKFEYYAKEKGEKTKNHTPWLEATVSSDHIVKYKIKGLEPGQMYNYQAIYGQDTVATQTSSVHTFKTNPGETSTAPVSFVVVTGMNYYHFHYGKYAADHQYKGPDKHLGYPALEAIKKLAPDYFIGTGDNVYFDHPATSGFERAKANGNNPLPGLFNGKEVTDEAGMRRKYHVQFVQPRFKELFSQVGTYWEKDDHDYRVNDSDPYMEFPISHELGVKNFKEQLPISDPLEENGLTYRTFKMSQDLQIWLLEGRDYRSANDMPDGPDKTIWGATQKAWLKKTLLESTATFKLLISPTPMVGPDDAYKKDNHVNHQGFRHEGDEFFKWLREQDFLQKNFYFICGDRHWQYHAIHPSGFEEFSTGALVDNNSRAGRLAGDPKSTDPDALIKQPFVQGTPESASGGFLMVTVDRVGDVPQATFSFYDEKGALNYKHVKKPFTPKPDYFICYRSDDNADLQLSIAFSEEGKALFAQYKGQTESLPLIFQKEHYQEGGAHPSITETYMEMHQGKENGTYELTHSGVWDYATYTRKRDGKVFQFTIDHELTVAGGSYRKTSCY